MVTGLIYCLPTPFSKFLDAPLAAAAASGEQSQVLELIRKSAGEGESIGWVTWSAAGRKVFEVAAFDDLDRQSASGSVVRQTEEQFGSATMNHRLPGRPAVAFRQAR